MALARSLRRHEGIVGALSLSEDSLKRNHPDKIVRLGPRRLGMKRRVALSLGKPLQVG